MMRLSLTTPTPPWRLSCLRGLGLAALRHAHRSHSPTALGPLRQQGPRAAAGSSNSSGQPGSEAEGPQGLSLTPQPTRRQQQQQLEQQWQQAYSQVLAFQQAHGRLPCTNASKVGPLLEGEEELGRWCAHQQRRKDGSKGPKLSLKQRTALQALPGWEWARARQTGRLRKDWWQWLREVEAFVAQHERLPRVSCAKSSPFLTEERQLGRWCDNQRLRYKGQQKPPLPPEQQAALAAIPGWFWEQWQQQDWEQQRQQVVAFQQQHGRLPREKGSSSQAFMENERQLGQWCKSQRQRWKGTKQPLLSAEQEAALAAIPGWFWEQWQQQDWKQQYQRVVAFQQQYVRLPRQNGSSLQPLAESEGQLGRWCVCQRRRYEGHVQPALSAEQEAALLAIPGWYWKKYKQQN